MLNSIALFVTRWLVNSSDPVILRDPTASVPRTEDDLGDGPAPRAGRQRAHPAHRPVRHGGAVLRRRFVLRRTTFGFETITVGTQPARRPLRRDQRQPDHRPGDGARRAASPASPPRRRSPARTTSSSRARSPFIGFDGIAIALLARANPLAIIPAALPVGFAAGRGPAHAAGGRRVDRRRAHHPVDGAAVRRRRRHRALRVPHRRAQAGRHHSTRRRPDGARHEQRRSARPTPDGRLGQLGPRPSETGTRRRRARTPPDRRRPARASSGSLLARRSSPPTSASETKAFAFEPPPDPLQVELQPASSWSPSSACSTCSSASLSFLPRPVRPAVAGRPADRRGPGRSR